MLDSRLFLNLNEINRVTVDSDNKEGKWREDSFFVLNNAKLH